jgi:hypothetical protein
MPCPEKNTSSSVFGANWAPGSATRAAGTTGRSGNGREPDDLRAGKPLIASAIAASIVSLFTLCSLMISSSLKPVSRSTATAAAGDQLSFVGFGPGATFTNIDATHWAITYNGGANTEVITFQNGASIDATDFVFI